MAELLKLHAQVVAGMRLFELHSYRCNMSVRLWGVPVPPIMAESMLAGSGPMVCVVGSLWRLQQ
jgi:hypothetical protein